MTLDHDFILELAPDQSDRAPLPFAELVQGTADSAGDLNSLAVITWNRFTITTAVQKFLGATILQAADPGNINACKLLAPAAFLFGIDAGKARIFKGDEEKIIACIERGPRFTHFLNLDKCKELIPDEGLLQALLLGLKDEGFLKETDGKLYLSAGGFMTFKVGK
jgi:hypothetical protein